MPTESSAKVTHAAKSALMANDLQRQGGLNDQAAGFFHPYAQLVFLEAHTVAPPEHVPQMVPAEAYVRRNPLE